MRKLPLLPFVLILVAAFFFGLFATLAASQAISRSGGLPGLRNPETAPVRAPAAPTPNRRWVLTQAC